jgi:hypothetical protein
MSKPARVRSNVGVADEAWIAVAGLHRKNPKSSDFSIDEIMREAYALRVSGEVRPGVYVHVVQHCVANRPAKPAKHRMLFETSEGRRRLFRLGDAAHPDRLNGKITPAREELPSRHEDLLDWYEKWSREKREFETEEEDPLLALRGSGKHLWADEHADDYVRRLREGWS